MTTASKLPERTVPSFYAILTLIKPVTWFPPMWAFLCGAVSSSNLSFDTMGITIIGLLLSGPIICGMSQAVNDWYDREVDSINEPNRPIPSGKIPGKWGLWIAISMSIVGALISWFLGIWGFCATILAIICAWAYSAEPVRLKRSGIIGPGVVALCYEGLPWFTGVAILTSGFPQAQIIFVAAIYAFGAFGIMTLNDFKAIEGDTKMGIRSLPVLLGLKKAGIIACSVMVLAQMIITIFLFAFNMLGFSMIICALLILQIMAMFKMMKNPKELVPWYNGTGVLLYVLGMMITAFAVGSYNFS